MFSLLERKVKEKKMNRGEEEGKNEQEKGLKRKTLKIFDQKHQKHYGQDR